MLRHDTSQLGKITHAFCLHIPSPRGMRLCTMQQAVCNGHASRCLAVNILRPHIRHDLSADNRK
jgi:hypothetical protein